MPTSSIRKKRTTLRKGKIFTVIGREIAVAVKEGGPDPANNSKLRDVIAKAKSNNMPNDTIERGIKKAAGDCGCCQLRKPYLRRLWPQRRRYHRRYADRQQEPDGRQCTEAPLPRAAETSAPREAYPLCLTSKGQIIIDKEECDMDAGRADDGWLWTQAPRISPRKKTATK